MADLRAKAGPLPIWAWGAILGVGAVAFIYWRSSKSAAAGAATSTTTDTSGAGLDASGLGYSAAGLGATSGDAPSATNTSAAAPTFMDNASWESGIVQWLNSQGQDPIKVRAALDAYINGGVLTSQQLGIVEKAIGYGGDAPDGLLGTPTEAPTPVVTGGGSVLPNPSTPPHHTTLPVAKPVPHKVPIATTHYTIRPGDTLSGLAKKYYGSASAANIQKIARANHLSNPNLIVSGHSLVIPK